MTEKKIFEGIVNGISEVIDDFIDWCIENVEFWQDDRTPEEYMIIDHLEKCRNKQDVDVIKDYDVIFYGIISIITGILIITDITNH